MSLVLTIETVKNEKRNCIGAESILKSILLSNRHKGVILITEKRGVYEGGGAYFPKKILFPI